LVSYGQVTSLAATSDQVFAGTALGQICAFDLNDYNSETNLKIDIDKFIYQNKFKGAEAKAIR